MGRNNLLGAWGEALAAEYLRKKRWTLVAQGYRSPFGEIDLIVKNRQHLVFVEVKLRKNADFGQAREFVTPSKQARIRKTALWYLNENPTGLQPRFDIIEVYAPYGTATPKPEIIHLEEAFQ